MLRKIKYDYSVKNMLCFVSIFFLVLQKRRKESTAKNHSFWPGSDFSILYETNIFMFFLILSVHDMFLHDHFPPITPILVTIADPFLDLQSEMYKVSYSGGGGGGNKQKNFNLN